MDNPLSHSNAALVPRVAIAIVAVAIVLLIGIWGVHAWQPNDPYVKEVLTLVGNADRGQAIFQMNCASCHGILADGRVGPSLHHVSERKSPTGLIKQVTSGQTPPMPQFQPSPEDMADLLQYLKSL